MKVRDEKIKELIKQLAAEFLSHQSNRQSLITVTDVRMSRDMKKGTVLLSIFPEDKAETAVNFAKRKRSEFREFAKKNMTMRSIPVFDFEIDLGEKNRQKIDELGRNA